MSSPQTGAFSEEGIPTEQSQERRVRAKAARRGLVLTKSRVSDPEHGGQFRLSDVHNRVVLGDKFDATLDEVEQYLETVSL